MTLMLITCESTQLQREKSELDTLLAIGQLILDGQKQQSPAEGEARSPSADSTSEGDGKEIATLAEAAANTATSAAQQSKDRSFVRMASAVTSMMEKLKQHYESTEQVCSYLPVYK